MRLKSRVVAAVAGAVLASGASVGVAEAEIGDGTASFEGGTITLEQAAANDYVCIFDENEQGTCYRTEEEADAAEGVPAGGAAANCGKGGAFWENRNFRGWRITLKGRGYWGNLTPTYNNQISSFKMSRWGGHLAKRKNGEGGWYPGRTGPCDADSYLGDAWNDTITSIFMK